MKELRLSKDKKMQPMELDGSHVSQVKSFVASTSGLQMETIEEGSLCVCQKVDGKGLVFRERDIAAIMSRKDDLERPFIQVNFQSGKKVLLTDQLIGFKPIAVDGLGLETMPSVVASPDLVSLFEAMEECLQSNSDNVPAFMELRHAFMSIVEGGEAVGIDFDKEKFWLKHLVINKKTAVAC